MKYNKRRYIKISENSKESTFEIGKEEFLQNLLKYNSKRNKVNKNLQLESFSNQWVI